MIPKRKYILNKLKVLLVLPLFCAATAIGQNATALTLDTCYKLARLNYPMIKQLDLIEKTRQYSVENASKSWLPQLNISGQATYQSSTITIPFDIPHVTFPTYSRDQYKIYGEVDQNICDAGAVQNQKLQQNADAMVQKQNMEVTLYALKDRVDQVFFGVLLLDEQLKQNTILEQSIQNSIDRIQAQVSNGTALKSGLAELKAEFQAQEQVSIQYKANKKAYLQMLGLLINRSLDTSIQLIKPQPAILSDVIKRPELTYYDAQKVNYNVQDRILNSNNLPKLSAFFQGGYGRPGLNLLSNDFSFYYIGGLRLSWQLGGFYTAHNSREILDIDRKELDLQKETFVLNTNIQMKQQNGTISQLNEMILKDDEIIANRAEVTASSKQQMENGTFTVHDYIGELDLENQARQNKNLHDIQLLQALYNYQNTTGN